MTDWKGTKVRIRVESRSAKVFDEEVYLDTDTVADLMDLYSPLRFNFSIIPVVQDPDE